jgi:hypothetical protein
MTEKIVYETSFGVKTDTVTTIHDRIQEYRSGAYRVPSAQLAWAVTPEKGARPFTCFHMLTISIYYN